MLISIRKTKYKYISVNITNVLNVSTNIGLLQGTSAPVNIPGSTLNSFSPNNHSNMFNVSGPFSHLSDPSPKINNSFHNDSSLFFQSHLISPNLGDTLSMSPDLR